jgi:hypothetical protein
VNVYRVEKTVDDYGSYTEAQQLIVSGLDCHIWQLSGDEVDEYKKKEADADYNLMCSVVSGTDWQSGLGATDPWFRESDVVYVIESDRMELITKLDITYINDTIPHKKYWRLGLLERKETS